MGINLKELITGRRSVRSYEDRPLPGEIIKELIATGVHAPSGSNMQPWAFAVVEDKLFMREWSDRTKEFLLEQMGNNPYFRQYRPMMENKDFNIFYNSPCLLLVYGNSDSPNHVFDCSMAAQNIMLSAHHMGLGSCWIGFATALGNSPEIRERLGVPEKYRLVAPLILGYPKGSRPAIPRKDPEILAWLTSRQQDTL